MPWTERENIVRTDSVSGILKEWNTPMSAKYCSKCGNEKGSHVSVHVSMVITDPAFDDGYADSVTFSLCQACANELDEFLSFITRWFRTKKAVTTVTSPLRGKE